MQMVTRHRTTLFNSAINLINSKKHLASNIKDLFSLTDKDLIFKSSGFGRE